MTQNLWNIDHDWPTRCTRCGLSVHITDLWSPLLTSCLHEGPVITLCRRGILVKLFRKLDPDVIALQEACSAQWNPLPTAPSPQPPPHSPLPTALVAWSPRWVRLQVRLWANGTSQAQQLADELHDYEAHRRSDWPTVLLLPCAPARICLLRVAVSMRWCTCLSKSSPHHPRRATTTLWTRCRGCSSCVTARICWVYTRAHTGR